ncbi:protein DpdH [Scytonema sp. NUACC26]|uniref:protein DpdH n=1 Tax=Scytonema sp. NUACC26 TaxID=3140176 RepID=UPI0034DCA2A1
MSFQNFVCWNLDMVHHVMNVEATQPPNHLFLATHHPITMYRQELIGSSSQIKYDEQQFLKDFLAEKDFAFVPVLGTSGTGKSHLIRWLAANIKSTDKRKVLLIPKIGTNLKDIIGLILEGMEGEKFDKYRQRLSQATNTLTDRQAREQLLNQLAVAVGKNGNRDTTQLTEEQNHLVEELDSLLYDPFFREHWLKDNGIIHRLTIHILGQRDTVEIVEERRQFSIDDLPLNLLDLKKAGQQAKEFYRFLISNENIKKATVDWLNDHLDEAIIQVLNLGQEDLQKLMTDVRETLAEQDIELVLLIEDFAKLQGIDREVLEAVLARPEQPGRKPLCSIRTALACTTGYFQSLIDTVQQRVTFSVTLDIGKVDQSLISQDDIQHFVARYLNAVRLEEEVILNWANSHDEEENSQSELLVSACTECVHRQACHTGFGEVNGMGLYPFTDIAIKQMLGRVNPENFNPRILIKDVLKYTLENGCDDIKQGCFPGVNLREHFGRIRLGAMLQGDIKAKDSKNYDRRTTLIELWTDSNVLCDLPAEVHTAFNLPSLNVKTYNTKGTQTNIYQLKRRDESSKEKSSKYQISSKSISDSQEIEISNPLIEKLKKLDNWNNQGDLSQDIAQNLRDFIFPAIVQRIEWDSEILLEKEFASSGSKYFKQKNIVFHSPKVTRETIAGVKLKLPLNPDNSDEFRETAIAFQGIIQYKYYKNWKFPDGDRYFRLYSKYLEKWSQYVLDGIRRYPRESGEAWNPVPAAVELLAITATMAGHPTDSLENLINSLFLEIDNNNDANRASSWKKLFESLKKYRVPLLEIVKSRIACTKGSSNQFQIIDAVQILEPLKQISHFWQPQCEIPKDISGEFSDIDKARQQVNELLEKAIEEECERQLNSYQVLISELGENPKKKDVIEAVKQAMDKAQDVGGFRGKEFTEMAELLKQFNNLAISSYMKSMQRLKTENSDSETPSRKLLRYLSENHQKVMTDGSAFLKDTNHFLDASLFEAQKCIADLEQSGGLTVESTHNAISDGLADLRSLIHEIKGEL